MSRRRSSSGCLRLSRSQVGSRRIRFTTSCTSVRVFLAATTGWLPTLADSLRTIRQWKPRGVAERILDDFREQAGLAEGCNGAETALLSVYLFTPVRYAPTDQGFAGRLVGGPARTLSMVIDIVRKPECQRGFQIHPRMPGRRAHPGLADPLIAARPATTSVTSPCPRN